MEKPENMSKVVSEDDLAILLKAGLSQEDVRHCILVAEKALDIAGRTGKALDMVLIARGALFHDLGKALTHSYQHGEIGAEMGKRYGLPKAITDIARKHFHGGTARKRPALDLPVVDYTPRLLEERIILYSDRLIDIITEGFFNFHDDRKPSSASRKSSRIIVAMGKTNQPATAISDITVRFQC